MSFIDGLSYPKFEAFSEKYFSIFSNNSFNKLLTNKPNLLFQIQIFSKIHEHKNLIHIMVLSHEFLNFDHDDINFYTRLL